MDKEKRKLNVVVHNLPEQEGDSLPERMERDQHLFAEVIKEGMNLIVRPTKAFRVGKRVEDKPRLLIVSLESMDSKLEILKMAPQLRYLTKWQRIYVTPDLSKKEREESKRLRAELSARRQAGEEHLTIRRGKIVKTNETEPRPEHHPENTAHPPIPPTVNTEQMTTQLQSPVNTSTGQDIEYPPVRHNPQPQPQVRQVELPHEGTARQA